MFSSRRIEWLLPLSTEPRRKELQAALDKPEWTTDWPEWEECNLKELLERAAMMGKADEREEEEKKKQAD